MSGANERQFTEQQVWAVIVGNWIENKRPSSVVLRRMLATRLREARTCIYGPDFPFPEYRREALREMLAIHRADVAEYVSFDKDLRLARERLFMLWLSKPQSERAQ